MQFWWVYEIKHKNGSQKPINCVVYTFTWNIYYFLWNLVCVNTHTLIKILIYLFLGENIEKVEIFNISINKSDNILGPTEYALNKPENPEILN